MNISKIFCAMLISINSILIENMAFGTESITINKIDMLQRENVNIEEVFFKEKQAIKVTMPSNLYQNPETDHLTDRPIFAWLPISFKNGIIELNIASEIAKDAPSFARGFVGIAFRISKNNHFEGLYLRPANGRTDDQIRRNHSVQYFSYPDYDFARLRKEEPEQYESYADIGLSEWIHMKIIVSGKTARLYVNNMHQPALVVNDLKLGASHEGGIGLWLESGTVGFFNDVTITPTD